MSTRSQPWINRCLAILSCLLILRILVSVLWNYPNYFPPNFSADFLLGREDYFWLGYHGAFFPHLISGPISLLLGMLLVNQKFLQHFPRWHRRLGRIQAVNVLFLVAPTGLWMGFYAASGPIAAVGFIVLACLTGFTVILGWRAALQRNFVIHRRWMWRCFLLLCSTVLVRVNGGLGDWLNIQADWFYIQIAWTSWLIPLVVDEIIHRARLSPISFPSKPTARSMPETASP